MVAVAPIIVIMVAILAILIYYGTEWLGKIIIRWTPDWDFGIGNLRDVVRVVVDGAIDLVRALLYPVVHPVVSFIEGTAVWVARIIGGLVDLTHQAAIALHEVRAVIIPALADRIRDWALSHLAALGAALGARLHDLRDWAAQRFGDLRAWAAATLAATAAALGARIHDLRDWTVNALGGVRDWVVGLVSAAVAEVAHDVAALRTWTAQRVLGVEADLATAVAGVETDIAKGVLHAEHYAESVALDAATDVRDLITDGVSAAAAVGVGLITDDIPELLGVIASDFPDLRGLLGDLDLAKLGDLAGVLGIEFVLSRVMARYLRDCGIPNCRNLGGFGRFLEDLLSAAGVGALLAMLAEIVHDPEGAAETTVSALGGLFTEATNLAGDLLGV